MRRRRTQFGVFVWTAANRYPRANAVKVYDRAADAERFARKHLAENYVMRTLDRPPPAANPRPPRASSLGRTDSRRAAHRRNPSLVTYLANPGHGAQIASDVQAILYRHARDGAYYLHVFGNQGDGELTRSRGREYLRIDNLPARTGVQLVGHGKVLTVRHRGGRALEREF